jgi:hypothetical protein
MEWFSGDIQFNTNFEQINTREGIIKGVKMVSEGEASGHGVFLNKKFISKTVALGKAAKNGVKARFGHPNMCNESLGTYLGVYKNIRLKKEKREKGIRYHALGDLHLSKTAKETPHGDLYNYILSLAKEAPDKFGSSIVFSGDAYEGKYTDLEGEEQEGTLAEIESLKATDLVDEPAATDSLFSDTNAGQFTEFLDTHPQLFEIYEKKPEILDIFLNKYKLNRKRKMSLFNRKKEEVKETLLTSLTSDGKTIAYYGELNEGTEIDIVGSDSENYAGIYELQDGNTIVVNEENLVEEITETEVKELSFDVKEFEEKIISAFTEVISEKTKEFAEKVESLESKFNELRTKGSDHTPEQTSVNNESSFSVEDIMSKAMSKLNDKKNLKLAK